MSDVSVIKNSVVVLGGSVCTDYGRQVTRCLVENLAVRGIHIVSGLETDISFIALTTALSVKGSASGFLAGDLKLARRIKPVNKIISKLLKSRDGSLYVPKEGSARSRNPFLDRDRSMVLACEAILVIEALPGSRVFHAVELAVKNNKLLFAVPGSIFSYTGRGTNFLICTDAIPVSSHKDIIAYI